MTTLRGGSGSKNARRKNRPLRLVRVLELVDCDISPALSQDPREGRAPRATQCLVDTKKHVIEVVFAGIRLLAIELATNGGQKRLREPGFERWRGKGERLGRRADRGHPIALLAQVLEWLDRIQDKLGHIAALTKALDRVCECTEVPRDGSDRA